MTAYKRRTYDITEADQWFRDGDHPADTAETRLVEPFPYATLGGRDVCPRCQHSVHVHGWIKAKFVKGQKPWEEGSTVCPGDYVITEQVWINGHPTYSVAGRRSFEHAFEVAEVGDHGIALSGS